LNAEERTLPVVHIPAVFDSWRRSRPGGVREKRSAGVTEIVKIPGRGQALTIDGGWREVADTALGFIKKHG
jgi:non-heme chloroperoxidase